MVVKKNSAVPNLISVSNSLSIAIHFPIVTSYRMNPFSQDRWDARDHFHRSYFVAPDDTGYVVDSMVLPVKKDGPWATPMIFVAVGRNAKTKPSIVESLPMEAESMIQYGQI